MSCQHPQGQRGAQRAQGATDAVVRHLAGWRACGEAPQLPQVQRGAGQHRPVLRRPASVRWWRTGCSCRRAEQRLHDKRSGALLNGWLGRRRRVSAQSNNALLLTRDWLLLRKVSACPCVGWATEAGPREPRELRPTHRQGCSAGATSKAEGLEGEQGDRGVRSSRRRRWCQWAASADGCIGRMQMTHLTDDTSYFERN